MASVEHAADGPPTIRDATAPDGNGRAVVASQRTEPAEGVGPSSCSCKGGPAQLVYALGKLGYDFGSEARRDWFRGVMKGQGPGGGDLDPFAPLDLEAFFQGTSADEVPARLPHPEAAEALIWIEF